MESKKGTPLTLNEAISNGLDASRDSEDPVSVIENCVRDFLSQKFTVAFLREERGDKKVAEDLWHRVSKRVA